MNLKVIGIVIVLVSIIIIILISPQIVVHFYGRKLLTEQTENPQIVISCDLAKIEGDRLSLFNPIILFNPNISSIPDKPTIKVYNRWMGTYLRTDVSLKVSAEIKLPIRAVITVDGVQFEVTNYRLSFSEPIKELSK